MGVFRQLGDPVAAAAGLCQHHAAEYAEFETTAESLSPAVKYNFKITSSTIVQVAITITETCCVVVNAAAITYHTDPATGIEIERPFGSVRTQQEDVVLTDQLRLRHYAAWEVLPAGNYTYFLVNRAASSYNVFAAWIKAVASDCLG